MQRLRRREKFKLRKQRYNLRIKIKNLKLNIRVTSLNKRKKDKNIIHKNAYEHLRNHLKSKKGIKNAYISNFLVLDCIRPYQT